MKILEIKLQIFLGLVICFLVYQHITEAAKPDPATQTLAEYRSGSLQKEAKLEAKKTLETGDVSTLRERMAKAGLLGNTVDFNNIH